MAGQMAQEVGHWLPEDNAKSNAPVGQGEVVQHQEVDTVDGPLLEGQHQPGIGNDLQLHHQDLQQIPVVQWLRSQPNNWPLVQEDPTRRTEHAGVRMECAKWGGAPLHHKPDDAHGQR